MKRREFLIGSSSALAATLWAPGVNAAPAATEVRTTRRRATGPLRVHPRNGRYFTDGSGKTIYLTGSHTWLNLQDIVAVESDADYPCPTPFDYDGFLNFLQRYNHNFFRLWAWESTSWVLPDSTVVRLDPMPFARLGPAKAPDGRPKFDPAKLNQAYFDRIRRRVVAAGERGIYVAVMLFQGFSVSRKSKRRKSTPWDDHPFHKDNNTLDINGDADGDGEGYEVHTLGDPAITKLQEAYVRKVIDTVGDLDNVIYEISNECHGESTAWHYHIIDLIHRYEKSKPKRHPVWMSFQWDGIAGSGSNRDLFEGPAEIISPSRDAAKGDARYRNDPPAADGSKVIIADTDHLWGIGGSASWVWKSFLRGLHPIFMDPYKNSPHHRAAELDAKWEPIRRGMGHTLQFANRMNLAAMTPQSDLASTRYCLANPGKEYLVYLPSASKVSLDLSAAKGKLAVEWFDPRRGQTTKADPARGGTRQIFTTPFDGDAVLYLIATESKRDCVSRRVRSAHHNGF